MIVLWILVRHHQGTSAITASAPLEKISNQGGIEATQQPPTATPHVPLKSFQSAGLTPPAAAARIPVNGNITNIGRISRPPRSPTSNNKKSAKDYLADISWQEFVSLPEEPFSVPREAYTAGSNKLNICPPEVFKKLSEALSPEDLQWCKWALSDSGGRVKVGKSYGTLNSKQRDKYEQLNCNVVDKGQNPSCEDAW